MKIFYGPKGAGKTKAIIDSANEKIASAKGHVVFITDTDRYAFDLKHEIRLVNVEGFEIQGMDGFRGFLKGMVAANADNEYIYVDGIARICRKAVGELENIFSAMEKLEKDFGVNFVLTVSASKEDLPEFVLKYVE